MNAALSKFEPNAIVRNVQNFTLFDKNPSFLKLKQVLKQVFYGKLLIFKLLSFGVPKIMVVRYVKPG